MQGERELRGGRHPSQPVPVLQVQEVPPGQHEEGRLVVKDFLNKNVYKTFYSYLHALVHNVKHL